MIKATMMTTIKIPVQTPALKIPSITEQLVISNNVADIRDRGTIFFIMDLLLSVT